MGKVSIVTAEKAEASSTSPAVGGQGKSEMLAYLDGDSDPIHTYLLHSGDGEISQLSAERGDLAAYVWQGAYRVGDVLSSARDPAFIVEHGSAAEPVTRNIRALVSPGHFHRRAHRQRQSGARSGCSPSRWCRAIVSRAA